MGAIKSELTSSMDSLILKLRSMMDVVRARGSMVVRGTNNSFRRMRIRGHDGSLHPFQIQSPAGRHCRREERITQLFRSFNSTLLKKKEAKSAVLLSPDPLQAAVTLTLPVAPCQQTTLPLNLRLQLPPFSLIHSRKTLPVFPAPSVNLLNLLALETRFEPLTLTT